MIVYIKFVTSRAVGVGGARGELTVVGLEREELDMEGRKASETESESKAI